MSTYRLDRLMAPKSVALIGASPRSTSVGRAILQNLRKAGFPGPVRLVNPRHDAIDGVAAVNSVAALPEPPDVALVCTPPAAVPGTIAALADRGCAAAIVITSGLGHGTGSLADRMQSVARSAGLRIVGPNCLGVIAPHARLNASFAARMAAPGDLALISQSGAIVAGLVEWAAHRNVGFSGIVSLGDQADTDFGDWLDYFATDARTRAILLYIESVPDARKFMSAARAAARVKPVVAVKSGRHEPGARAASTHTGALAGSDDVYDAALRRAGVLRVTDLDELFAAAETLGRLRPFAGRRLAVLTNGGGIGVLAVDRLMDLGGKLAVLSDSSILELDRVLPPTWSKANPVDIGGDSGAERYETAMAALFADPGVDAVLVMNVPTALASAHEAARSVASAARRHRDRHVPAKPVLATWVGGDPAAAALFGEAGVPHFSTESEAVTGFMHLVGYREAQEALMETPPSLPAAFRPDRAAGRSAVAAAIAEGRRWLDPVEAASLLAAYQIPSVPVMLAESAERAAELAAPLIAQGQSVAVKIMSPDIVHKSDVGGVRLDLATAESVRAAASDLLAKAARAMPDARIRGVIVQPMIRRPKARELIAGIADDPTFGPVVVFGQGGVAVEAIDDKALAMPPIDLKQAADLIARTRVSRVLKAYRNVPAADALAVQLVLVKLAQMAADLPELREIDLNPLLADETGAIAVDARVAVAPSNATRSADRSRFAIRPYPVEWEKAVTLRDSGSVLLRPVRPEDEPLYRSFFPKISAEDLRLRFFAPVKDFGHNFIARLTQIDYARAMAFVAIGQKDGELLGVVRLHADANRDRAEFAILVRSDLKGRGLGWIMMNHMLDYAAAESLAVVEGQILAGNTTMLTMCQQLGFEVRPDPQDPDVMLATRVMERPAGSG